MDVILRSYCFPKPKKLTFTSYSSYACIVSVLFIVIFERAVRHSSWDSSKLTKFTAAHIRNIPHSVTLSNTRKKKNKSYTASYINWLSKRRKVQPESAEKLLSTRCETHSHSHSFRRALFHFVLPALPHFQQLWEWREHTDSRIAN